MKEQEFRFLLFAAAMMMFSMTSCTGQNKVDVESDIDAINTIYKQATLAVRTADLVKYLANFTEDAIVMAPGYQLIRGKEELRAELEGYFKKFDLELPYTVEEVEVIGDWAFARTTWEYFVTPIEGGETKKSVGKELDVLQRLEDGSWKIIRQCYNYDPRMKAE